jgi:hypothetical protein
MTYPPPGTRDACPTRSSRGTGPFCGAAVPAAGWVGGDINWGASAGNGVTMLGMTVNPGSLTWIPGLCDRRIRMPLRSTSYSPDEPRVRSLKRTAHPPETTKTRRTRRTHNGFSHVFLAHQKRERCEPGDCRLSQHLHCDESGIAFVNPWCLCDFVVATDVMQSLWSSIAFLEPSTSARNFSVPVSVRSVTLWWFWS